MTEVNNLEELIETLDTVTGKHLVPQADELIIKFDIELPIKEKKFKSRFLVFTEDTFRFEKCHFNGKVTFVNNKCKLYIQNCKFNEIVWDDAIFEDKVRFRVCEFRKKVVVNNATFKQLADFWRSTFNERVIFYKTNFEETTVLSACIFKKNVLFTYSLIEKLAIFRGTVFKKGLDLSLAIIGGDLGLYDLKLKDYESIEAFIPENEYDRIVSIIGDIPAKNKRETFRVLKKYHIDQKNPVEYEDFSLLESISHRREVWRRLKSERRRWKDFWDYSLLTLNRVSNKHKTNYWRGFLFTAIIGWVFFYFALITTELISTEINPFNWSLDTFSLSAKHYFISLTPTHKYTYMDELKPNSWFYLWDFLGRLFIAYGIYQSVQAFRKFR